MRVAEACQNPSPEVHSGPEEVAPPKRKRTIVHRSHVPDGALRWSGRAEKAERLMSWRRGILRHFRGKGTALGVAWELQGLFSDDGFAYPSDGFLAEVVGVPRNRIQAVLAEMEKVGAIVRAHAIVGRKVERRIFPGAKVADEQHLKFGCSVHPKFGSHNTNRKTASVSGDPIALARRDAERRAKRDRERLGPRLAVQ